MTILADSADYPLMGILWSMVVFFGWILWFWLLITVYSDMFRRKDIGGGMKTLWVIFTLFLPFLGVFVYLIAQGKSMAEREVQRREEQQAAMAGYVRSVAGGSGGPTDELAKAKSLLDDGAITAQEYESMKRKILN